MLSATSAPFKPPHQAPPPNYRALIAVVQRYADHHEIAFGRAQRWLSYAIVGAVLRRCLTVSGDPAFVLKGGAAIELRLRRSARVTKDIDAIYRATRDVVLADLDRIFAEPYQGFGLRRAGEPLVRGQFTRFEIKLDYRGKPWGTVALEVSFDPEQHLVAEDVPAIALTDFGFQGPAWLPCLVLTTQIAQKLHAMTEPLKGGRRNERYRDLLDVWVLRDQVPPTSTLRATCEDTFARRATHPWPPPIIAHEHWVESFASLAADLGLSITAMRAAADVQDYVARTARS